MKKHIPNSIRLAVVNAGRTKTTKEIAEFYNISDSSVYSIRRMHFFLEDRDYENLYNAINNARNADLLNLKWSCEMLGVDYDTLIQNAKKTIEKETNNVHRLDKTTQNRPASIPDAGANVSNNMMIELTNNAIALKNTLDDLVGLISEIYSVQVRLIKEINEKL